MSNPTPDIQELENALQRARRIAADYRHEYFTLEHALYVCLEYDAVRNLMEELDVKPDKLKDDVLQWLEGDNIPTADTQPRKVGSIDAVTQKTVARVIFSGRQKIDMKDFILCMVEEQNSENDSWAGYFLRKHGVTPLALKEALSHGGGSSNEDEDEDAQGGGMAGAMGGQGDPLVANPERMGKKRAKKVLEKFCINLNEKASNGGIDPLIGRETEVETIVHSTARRTKNNVVLLGEAGVGKTAIVEGLAKRITDGNVPEIISDATVWSLDVANLVAGTRFRGDFEERMKAVLKALTVTDTNPILFIDEIHMILGSGSAGQSSMDVANLLKPALARGEIRCIGSTTLEEYRKDFEKDRALNRRFQRQDVEEPSIENAKRIMEGLKQYYEEYHKVEYDVNALHTAVELTDKYVTNKYLPDKAIDVMDAAGARQRILPEEVRVDVISNREIEYEVARIARMPEKSVGEDEREKLVDLERDLKDNVYGQDDALNQLTDAVYVSRAGLREPNKPSGSYLFTGPTGVGKTEAAKQLAHRLGIHFERFDMSEYMEQHSVSKLIGAPPGYVGFEDTNGLLVDAIDSHPHCVLLLDEIEKAHPDVYNVLLQVMDSGRITNTKGKSVDFQNVFIIMTSNAGASEAEREKIGFGTGDEEGNRKEDYNQAIKQMFSPEFRNRLDAVITFNTLSLDIVTKVVDKFIRDLNTLAAESKVKVEITEDAKKWLAEIGHDPLMGARPMERTIQQYVKKPLSRMMINGKLVNGGTAVVTLNNNDLIVDVKNKQQPVPEEG